MGIADSRTPRKCVSRAREASRVARLLLTSMTTRTRSNNNNNKAIRTSKRVKENLKKAEKEEKIRAKEEAKAKAKGAILVSPSSSSTTIATIPCVTLNQIRKAQSKSNVSKLDQPVRISSKKVREEIYREAEEAIENKEIAALPSYGGRWWKCKVRITESKPPPLFRWFRGQLELACLPHIFEKIEDMNDTENQNYYEEECKQTALENRKVSNISLFSLEHKMPNISYTWTSPNLETFRTRKTIMEHAMELKEKEHTINRVIHGLGKKGQLLKPIKITNQLALEGGLYRFERDGLWVMGQEESWQQERKQELCCGTNNDNNSSSEARTQNHMHGHSAEKVKKIQPVDCYILAHREQHKKDRLAELKNEKASTAPHEQNPQCTSKSNKISFSLSNAAKELRQKWKNLTEKEKEVYIEEARKLNKKQLIDVEYAPCHDQKKPHNNNNNTQDNNVCSSATSTTRSSTESSSSSSSSTSNNMKLTSTSTTTTSLPIDITAIPRLLKLSIPKNRSYKRSTNQYQLTPDQIENCLQAIVSHYQQIMNTVQARGLHHDLANGGFDLLRERGRGRYDMTIPQFDQDPTFAFLNDPNAFWMPVVRKILGEPNGGVRLVHKGSFMSLPGAESQIYHQDGVHLNQRFQKPCHAVNVFIPLVDLSMKNGPTEFCLGSHYLGNEHFNKDRIETPTPLAGNPIIFDYRLGHRGLGNSSNDIRPVVYLTYSTENKCFIDSVNFSKTRWKKIGDLIEMPLSREERVNKRRERLEEVEINQAMKMFED